MSAVRSPRWLSCPSGWLSFLVGGFAVCLLCWEPGDGSAWCPGVVVCVVREQRAVCSRLGGGSARLGVRPAFWKAAGLWRAVSWLPWLRAGVWGALVQHWAAEGAGGPAGTAHLQVSHAASVTRGDLGCA